MDAAAPEPFRRPRTHRGAWSVLLVLLGLPVLYVAGSLVAGLPGGVVLPLLALALVLMLDASLTARRQRESLAVLRVLAGATRRGIPLDRACFAAGVRGAGAVRGATRRALSRLGVELLRGGPLAGSLAATLPHLPDADLRAIEAAERRGLLPATLDRLAGVRGRALAGPAYRVAGPPPLRLAVAHAAAVLLALLGVWLFARLALFESFVGIFEEFGAPLPALTLVVFGGGGDLGFWSEVSVGGTLVMAGTLTLTNLFLLLCFNAVARVLPGPPLRRTPLAARLRWRLWPPHRHRALAAAYATVADALDAGWDLPAALADAADGSAAPPLAARLRRAAAGPDPALSAFPEPARALLAGPGGLRPRAFAALAGAAAERADASAALLASACLPAVVLLTAAPVGLFTLACSLPLIRLIEALSLEAFA